MKLECLHNCKNCQANLRRACITNTLLPIECSEPVNRNLEFSEKMNTSLWNNLTLSPWPDPTTSTTAAYTSENITGFLRNNTNSTTTSPETQENLNPFFFGLIFQSAIVLVVFGNVLVLTALACYRNWTPADVLLFSLSLADILDSIAALQLLTTVKYYMRRHMTETLCNLFIGLVYTFRLAAATTVTVMALERAMLLVKPFRHHTLITVSRMKKFVLGVWLFSIFSAILPFIGVGHSGFRNGECFSQIYNLGKAYAIYMEVLGALQLIAVLVSYFTIKLSGKMFIQRQTVMSGGGENEPHGTQNCKDKLKSLGTTSGVRNIRKLTKMMTIVVVVYYISWLPFLLYNLYCLIVDREPVTKVVVFTSVISLLHAVVNPPLYGWMSQRYRRGYLFVFKMALSVCGGKRPSRRTLSVSRRFCPEANLSRRATSIDLTVCSSRLSLPHVNLPFGVADKNRKEASHSGMETTSKTLGGKTQDDNDSNNNNNMALAQTEAEKPRVDDSLDKDVMQLLDSIIDRIEV